MRTLILNNNLIKPLIAVIAIIICFYAAKNVVHFSPISVMMLMSLALSVVVLSSHKYAILLVLTDIFAFDWLANTAKIVPREFTWAPEIVLMLLSAKLIFSRVLTRKKLLRTPVDLAFLMVIVVGITASVVHLIHPIVALMGFRNYLKYIVMFYLIANFDFDEKAFKQIITWFIILMAVQVPISIIQSFFWQPDFSAGTLGPGLLGQLGLSIISIMVGFAMYKGVKLRYILFCLLMICVWIISSAIAPFFLLPPIVLFLLRKHLPWRYVPAIVVGFLIIIIPLYYAVLLVFPIVGHTDLGFYLLSPRNVYLGQLGRRASGELNRLSGVAYAHKVITENPIRALVGVGPGNASPSFFSHYSGQFYSIKASFTSQIARTMLEYGYLGLFFFLMMIYSVFRMNARFMSGIDDSYWKAISFGFDGTIMAYVLGALYFPVWNDDLSPFTFWLFASAIYGVGLKRKILRTP